MKAQHRKNKAHGGESSEMHGAPEWKQDESHNPDKRNNASKIFGEAEEKKHGGRAKRKHGGMIHKHHEAGEHMKHAKHVGKVHGHSSAAHAGRKPRKSGGRTGCNMNPLSSAHAGTPAKGRHTVDID